MINDVRYLKTNEFLTVGTFLYSPFPFLHFIRKSVPLIVFLELEKYKKNYFT